MTVSSPLLCASDDKTFLENYGVLRTIPNLYIPVGWRGEITADPANTQAVLDFLDVAGTQLTEELYVSLVYTSRELGGPDAVLAELPTDQVLERIFHNERVGGVTFDGAIGESRPSHTVYRFVTPMMVGMLRSESVDCDAMTHAGKARECLSRDRIYECLFHAAQARRLGAPKDYFYFLELHALMTLRLNQQCSEYFGWWDGPGMRGERSLYEARALSLSGDTPGALKLLKQHFTSGKVAPMAWLERARALCIAQRYDEAVKAFDRCLESEQQNCDALIGKGIALRAIHYQPGNAEGLAEALNCFEAVEKYGDYHVPEALHHAGTIQLALSNWEAAENLFRKTLSLRGSDVSRRNLALVLHAQGRSEEGRSYYEWLLKCCPEQAAGLEKYFGKPAGNTVVHTVQKLKPEDIAQYVSGVRAKLKAHSMVWHNDALDWRRFDDYVDYYAPAGERFLNGSALHGLEGDALQQELLDISLHLAAIPVENGWADWVIPDDNNLADLQVQFREGCGVGTYNLFHTVLRRVEIGAMADNLSNLDMLISLSPDYNKLSRSYSNPYPSLPASPGRVAEFERRAQRACLEMKRRGFNLTGELDDLRELECIVMSLFQENGALKAMLDNETLTDDFVFDIALHLGVVCQKFSGGVWHDHDDIFGISIQCAGFAPIHPARRLLKRIEYGLNADSFTSLLSLEPSLVCADLANKFREHEISTREELAQVLAARLPNMMDEDPSGASLERMVTMITNFAATGSVDN